VDFCRAVPPADGFRLDKGAYETIAFPGASLTVPYRSNDRGQVVGSYLDAAGAPHGFLLEDGVYTEIETPGFPRAQLLGINDSGRIVGGYVDDGGTVHGLMRDERGRFTTFDAPGATTATGAIDINDRRQIVGIVR
jgi:YD repeat-containing protein